MAKLKINYERCKGCGLCTTVCPKKILELAKKRINGKGYTPVDCIDWEKCIQCGMCTQICPDVVLRLVEEQE